MKHQVFDRLSQELLTLSEQIPLRWGYVQNDKFDKKINLFDMHHLRDLEHGIRLLSEEQKNYFRRRWFLWKCAQCDEYLFRLNNNVRANPNGKDQDYDLEFNGDSSLRFDLKGTVIPRPLRSEWEKLLDNPYEVIQYFYQKQSKGVRNHLQNRIFVIHHSQVNENRENWLRCQWEQKKYVYEEYAQKVGTDSKFYNYGGVKADVILFLEDSSSNIQHRFFAVR